MHKIFFCNKFIIRLYMFRALCAHHQEVKIVLYSIWYHHTCRWPSGAQAEIGQITGDRSNYYRTNYNSVMTRRNPRRNISRITHKDSNKRATMRNNSIYSLRSLILCVIFLGILPCKTITNNWIESALNLCTGRPPTGVMIPDAV